MKKPSISDSELQPSTQVPAEETGHSLTGLLKNPFVIAYVVLYVIFLVLLGTVEKFDLTEPILILFIIGFGFSLLAWWITKGVRPLALPIKRPLFECILLAFYLLIGVVPFLTIGMNLIKDSFTYEPLRSVVVLTAKLIITVLIPLLLLGWLGRYSLRDFTSFSFNWKQNLLVAFWMSLVLVIFQLVFGSGLASIRQAGFIGWQWAVGIPFAFLWLMIEVGLAEEFFFRTLIQSRLAALFRSETSGVVLMSLLFGLAHAPGIYLRGADVIVGISPSPLMAIGYSIVVLSVTGLFLGILWSRTKNLIVLMLIHAAGDLIPNMVEIIKTWLV